MAIATSLPRSKSTRSASHVNKCEIDVGTVDQQAIWRDSLMQAATATICKHPCGSIVEALWKQEGPESFISLRKPAHPCLRQFAPSPLDGRNMARPVCLRRALGGQPDAHAKAYCTVAGQREALPLKKSLPGPATNGSMTFDGLHFANTCSMQDINHGSA